MRGENHAVVQRSRKRFRRRRGARRVRDGHAHVAAQARDSREARGMGEALGAERPDEGRVRHSQGAVLPQPAAADLQAPVRRTD